MALDERSVGFDPSGYDLRTAEGKKAYLRDWRAHLAKMGYRIEMVKKDEDGWYTLDGLAQITDIFTHNISITLRDTVDRVGRDSEAGKVVTGLWHEIMSNSLLTYEISKHLAEKDKK